MAALDPAEHRVRSRQAWEAVAAGWETASGVFYSATLPLARWMVDRLDPQPGQTVLEVAAGRGDVGFLAAPRLQPGGRLISTDGATAMVEVARRHGEALGVAGVEYRPMELEWLDEAAASVDGILCRFGYMLAVDPETALREARRVLRPGGRLVMGLWDAAGLNPWLTVLGEEARRAGHLPPPAPGGPGPFALSDRDHLTALIAAAGLGAPLIETVELAFAAPDLDVVWDAIRATSPALGPMLGSLSPADHYRLREAFDARWAPFLRPDGTVVIPARALGIVTEA